MSDDELWKLSASQLAERVRDGAVSASASVEAGWASTGADVGA